MVRTKDEPHIIFMTSEMQEVCQNHPLRDQAGKQTLLKDLLNQSTTEDSFRSQ